MNKSRILRTIIQIFGIVIVCVLLTIIAHAILPVKVDESRLDSALVRKYGFPAVAIMYFIILYTQCALMIVFSRKNSNSGGFKGGVHIGIAFALIYLIGMQEIMLDVSPFEKWSIEFVMYQLFMGLGDAIPVIVLCSVISQILFNKQEYDEERNTSKWYTIIIFMVAVGSARTIVSIIGIIENSLYTYPLEVVVWNYAFGIVIGICYRIVERHYKNKETIMVFGISLNWIIFNMFIGMIRKGTMLDALLRSGIDTMIIFVLVKILGVRAHKRNLSTAST